MQSANTAASSASWPGVSAAASKNHESPPASHPASGENSFPETFERLLNPKGASPRFQETKDPSVSSGKNASGSKGESKSSSDSSPQVIVFTVVPPEVKPEQLAGELAKASGHTSASGETASGAARPGNNENTGTVQSPVHREPAGKGTPATAAAPGTPVPAGRAVQSDSTGPSPALGQASAVGTHGRQAVSTVSTGSRPLPEELTGKPAASSGTPEAPVSGTERIPVGAGQVGGGRIPTQEAQPNRPASGFTPAVHRIEEPSDANRHVQTARPQSYLAAQPPGTVRTAAASGATRESADAATVSERFAATRQEGAAPERFNRSVMQGEMDSRSPVPREVFTGSRPVDQLVHETIGRELQAFWQQRSRINRFEGAGTSAAKQSEAVKNTSNPNQIAGRPEQNLPGTNGPGAKESSGAAASVNGTGQTGKSHLERLINPAGESIAMMHSGAEKLSGGSTEGLSPLSGSSLKIGDQMLLSMIREVMTFRHQRADSMAVVLKPDAGTEIFLHLSMKDGQIEVQARFERGDFAAVNAQWEQLQQSLNRQGVRLGPLQESPHQPGSNAQAGQQGQDGHPSSHEEDSRRPFDDALEDLVMSRNTRQLDQRVSRRNSAASQTGLEVWA